MSNKWPIRTLAVCSTLVAVFVWSYWTTIFRLVQVWLREPDYSHGFLVPPLAILFLWLRRKERPSRFVAGSIMGLGLILFSLAVRYVGARFSFASLDGYSMIVWLCGVALFLGGSRYAIWALPSISFLFFMVPLPFQVERLLSVPLQNVATRFSCFLLQCLGQPAFAEGTTILMGPHELHVEQACSGLRIFVGAFALGFAYLIATRRETWEQAILICVVVPIALLSNALRIVLTGFSYQIFASDDAFTKFGHDMAGTFMILTTAVLFALAATYLRRLVRKVPVVDMSVLVGRSRAEA